MFTSVLRARKWIRWCALCSGWGAPPPRCLQTHLRVLLFRPAGRRVARGNCLVLCFGSHISFGTKSKLVRSGRPRQLLGALPRISRSE